MLSVDYPHDWAVKEYPDDPRAKVEFRGPVDGAIVRLIATPARDQALDELLPDWEERKSQLRAFGTDATITSTTVRGVNAQVVTFRRVDALQSLVLFVDSGMFCNFSFESKPGARDRYQRLFTEFVENASLELPGVQSFNLEAAQLLASRIRRAELCRDAGNYTIAREAIDEGLALEPGNKRLIDIAAQIDETGPHHSEVVSTKQRAAAQERNLLITRSVTALTPLLFLVVFDYWQLPHFYSLPLLVLPFLDLNRQVNAWVAYLRFFGRPAYRTLRQMLAIDALRAYDSMKADFNNADKRSIIADSAPLIFVSPLSIILAYVSGWLWPIYIATVCSMLVLKAFVRRSRPPAVLLLGASGSKVTLLHLSLLEFLKPLEVVSLLRHTATSWVVDARLRFLNFRTRSDVDWRTVVGELSEICPVVVLDLRTMSQALQVERDICEALADQERLFVVAETDCIGTLKERIYDARTLPQEVSRFINGLRTSSVSAHR